MTTKTVHSIIDKSKSYQYVDDGNPKQGGMKDVFFSPDRSYVVAFYRDPQDYNARERLKKITTQYYDSFFNREGGDYYKNIYAWPTDVIEEGNRIGIIVPCYSKCFFFDQGYANFDAIQGQEKEGKWFASPRFRVENSRFKLAENELGDWLSYFQICTNISRGVKRMHAAGLAHSDLSYKNVLIDPVTKSAAIIDIDGLVVPGLFPPDVLGTPDFIAPEVMKTQHLPPNDSKRELPNRLTDLHALAVLIYMYLLYRHPLRGGNFFGDIDTEEEEKMLMGEKALFIEHPTNKSNQNFKREYGDDLQDFAPWTDLSKTPYKITGPYLSDLFEKAFVKGLHNPNERPPADSWEQALIKTNDLKLRCSNNKCQQKWFIYNNTKVTKCPFCGTTYKDSIPVLDFYYQFKPDRWRPDNLRMVVYQGSTLHQWHVSRKVIRNERLKDSDKARVGYFAFHNKQWVFVNETLDALKDITDNKIIAKGEMIPLTNAKKLLLSTKDGGRLMTITLTNQ